MTWQTIESKHPDQFDIYNLFVIICTDACCGRIGTDYLRSLTTEYHRNIAFWSFQLGTPVSLVN